MKVSYDEGIASHIGSESCGGIREDTVEALTGVCAGWVSSLDNSIRSADGLRPSEGNTGRIAIARFARTPRGLRPLQLFLWFIAIKLRPLYSVCLAQSPLFRFWDCQPRLLRE